MALVDFEIKGKIYSLTDNQASVIKKGRDEADQERINRLIIKKAVRVRKVGEEPVPDENPSSESGAKQGATSSKDL